MNWISVKERPLKDGDVFFFVLNHNHDPNDLPTFGCGFGIMKKGKIYTSPISCDEPENKPEIEYIDLIEEEELKKEYENLIFNLPDVG